MDRKQVMKLSIECGICDEHLSNETQVVTDYGDSTAAVLLFAQKIAEAEREACKLLADNCAVHCEDHDNGMGANAARDISDRIAERSLTHE